MIFEGPEAVAEAIDVLDHEVGPLDRGVGVPAQDRALPSADDRGQPDELVHLGAIAELVHQMRAGGQAVMQRRHRQAVDGPTDDLVELLPPVAQSATGKSVPAFSGWVGAWLSWVVMGWEGVGLRGEPATEIAELALALIAGSEEAGVDRASDTRRDGHRGHHVES